MYFLFLFPFCNIENLVGEGRVKGDGGRWEQKKTGEFIKNKTKERKQKVLHNHKQPHEFQNRENVGFFFAKIQEKNPKIRGSLSPPPRAPSPLLHCSSVGRHASSRWSVLNFDCFLIFTLFFAAVDHLPLGAQPPARPRAGPHCHLPVLLPAGLCCKRWGRLPPQPPSVPGGCDGCS